MIFATLLSIALAADPTPASMPDAAQDAAQDARHLSVEQALALARKQANDAVSAGLAVRGAEVRDTAARQAWTPSVSASFGTSGSLGSTFSDSVGSLVTEPNANLNAGLSASMPLYQGGRLKASKQAAAASLEAARSGQASTDQDLTWQTLDALLNLEASQAAVQVRESALEAERTLLELVEVQVEAGARTQADLHAQRSAVASAESALATARATADNVWLDLVVLLRLDPDEAWSFESVDAGSYSVELDPASLTRSALDGPAGQIVDAELDVAKAEVSVARAAWYPSIDLSVATSTSSLTSRKDPLSQQIAEQARGSIGLSVRFTLFDRGSRSAAAAAARLALEQAELNKRRLEDDASAEIRSLIRTGEASDASLRAAVVAEESARSAAEILELRYSAGAGDLSEVTQARARLVQAELETVRARIASSQVSVRIAYASGRLVS